MKTENKKTILLVEDEIITAMLEKKQLENMGYIIHHVSDGKKAVETILDNSLPIDLILMDIDLGDGIDGTQAAEEILKQKDIPVVFLSSHTEPEVVEKTEKITSYGYVVNNSNITVLDASIKMAFKLFYALRQEREKEAALRKSEEKYRLQFMNMESYNSMYEVLTDKEGIPYDFRFVMVNQAYEEYVGKKASELIGKTLLEVYPETEQYWIDKMKEAVLTGSPLHFENFSNVMNTYTEINLYTPQKGWLAMTTANIKGRKQAEEALRASEEKFRTITEQANALIAITDINGIVTYASSSSKTLFQYLPEEMHGRNFMEFLNESEIPKALEEFRDAIKNATGTHNLELKMKRKDGSTFIGELNGTKFQQGSFNGTLVVINDITERKQAEEALHEINSRFRSFIEQSPVSIGVWNLDGTCMYANQKFLDALSLESEDEIIGRPAFEFFSPQYREESKERTRRRLEGLPVQNEFEATLLRKDGTEFPMHMAVAPIKLSDKTVSISFLTDLTERRKVEEQLQKANEDLTSSNEELLQTNEEFEASNEELTSSQEVIMSREAELRESNELLLLFIKSSPIYAYIKEVTPTESRVLAASENFHEMIGIPGSKMIGRTMEELFPPEFASKITADDWLVASGGNVIRLDEDLNGRNYTTIKFPITLGEKKLTAGYTIDITDRKNIETELRKNEKDLTKTQKIAHIGNWRLDLKTNQVVWSEELYRMYDFNPELPPPPYTEHQKLFTPESWELLSSSLTRTRETGIPYELELKTVRKDGGNGWMWVRGETVLDEKGKIAGLWGAAQDITERKQSEEEIQKQLSEKTTLLKEVHHRIKNNIASIEGLLSLQSQAISNPEAVSALQDAISRVGSMRVLYDKLLISDDFKDISVKNYLESLIDSVADLFPDHLKITIDKKIDDFDLSSKNLFPIGIILNELLTNIMKYAFIDRKSGLIHISLSNIQNQVTLTIQDNGNGLPEGFDINKSNGFGLMLVRMLSGQLDGTFTIENHNGTRSILKFKI